MATTIRITGIKQLEPIASPASVQIDFEVLGILPDLVQVYASGLSGDLGDFEDSVDMTSPENTYSKIIQLASGGFYYIHLCPRTKSNGVLDDKMDGVYWETFCAMAQFTTRAPSSGSNLPPPWITSIQTLNKTLTRRNAIKIWWMSSKPYDAWNVRWNKDGAPANTDSQSPEIDSPGSGGWFVCGPTSRGVRYHIVVEGGESSGIFGGHNWSGWSPQLHVVAGDNYHGLREFLQASGVDGSKGIRHLVPTIGRISLRTLLGV